MKKFFTLQFLFLFLLLGCSTEEEPNVEPQPEPPVEETAIYKVSNKLADYYEGVDLTLEEDALYDELAVHTIGKHSTFLSYTQRHDYLYDADADPSNPANVIVVYSGDSRDKREYQSPSNPHDPQTFNTEHVYPQSKLEGDAVSDLHILRVVDRTVNGQRSNHPFTDGEGQYELINGDSFYPGDEWRGDVARMIMYMNLRYNEPFNEVGNLDLFLEWNAEDPVSHFEIQRNDVIERSQGNRNPFIDNPHLATNIWGGEEAANRWDGESDEEDNEAPSVPQSVTVAETTFETISLTWEASSDNVGVAKYYVNMDGEYYATVTSTEISVENLEPGTTYSFTIVASDSAGNNSEDSETVEATTVADEEAPTVPAGLAISSVTATSVSLSWEPATDNAEVQGYNIYLDGEFYKNVTSTEYSVAGLTPETAYTVSVTAQDIYENESASSEIVEFTTEVQGEPSMNAAIIISEYTEGSVGYNKALEIANVSDAPVDLTGYVLKKITNTNVEWDNDYALEGVLEAGDVLVLAHYQAEYEGILNAADFLLDHQIVNFNGNDPIGLFKDGELIDMLGNTGGENYAEDVNIRRKVSVPNTTYTPDEWEVYTDDNTEGLGSF